MIASSIGERWSTMCLVAIIICTCLIRIRLLDIPLERDEGEYAYMGQLILQGIPPYEEAYNMKMPGIYYLYAAIMGVLGQTTEAIHLGLMIVNSLSILLVFLIGRILFDGKGGGLIASSMFALITLSNKIHGLAANAEHFVMFFVLGGGLCLLISHSAAHKRTVIFSGGLLLGTAFIIKQHASMFTVFGLVYLIMLVHRKKELKHSLGSFGLYALGAILPFGLLCIYLWSAGVFASFWFWTFTYAREYTAMTSWTSGIGNFSASFGRIISSTPCFWILAAVGLLVGGSVYRSGSLKLFGLLFFIFSFFACIPGFYFRPHYFQFLIPAASLAAECGVVFWRREESVLKSTHVLIRNCVPAFCVVIFLGDFLYGHAQYLFQMSPFAAVRHVYGLNPFPEAVTVADYVQSHTTPEQSVAVLGSEPEIYFYARRKAATGFIYMYSLMEQHPNASRLQKQLIEEIEGHEPEIIVFIKVYTSWLITKDSNLSIFHWFDNYQRTHYQAVGVINILSSDTSYAVWGDAAQHYIPKYDFWLAVFRRKPSKEHPTDTIP